MNDSVLNNIKVIDLTQHIAGPYCTKLLADYGADVIKVERPAGDPARRIGPFPGHEPHLEKSGLFLYLNTNKRGVTLDLKSDVGRMALLDLVRDADVLVENYSPRVMPSLGLDYQTLSKVNPKLVMTSVSSFGRSGRYSNYRATELVLYALCGMAYITGGYHREPVKHGYNQAQYLGGVAAASGTVAALLGFWRNGGQGQQVDVSILECAISTLYHYPSGLHLRGYGLPAAPLPGQQPPLPCAYQRGLYPAYAGGNGRLGHLRRYGRSPRTAGP